MSDPTCHPVETPREWLRYAEGDLGVAEREMQYETPAYHTVCFLCQSEALEAAQRIRVGVRSLMNSDG